ncbi:MAG TPA: TIGR03086 family metal-binding protein [Jatrophihabitans sp.]|jgi:uncharacterized protein (TIGR03086 family)
MPDTIDPATFDRLATAATRSRLAALTVGDLDRTSTCAGWRIRDVLSHLVGGNIRFAQALRGERPDWDSRDREPVSAPLTEFDRTSAEMAAAIAAIDDPKRPVLLPAGEPPALFGVAVHAADMLVHGWDVAASTGQDLTLDPQLCLAATAVLDRYPTSFWGPGQFFASRIDTDSADPQQRLLAYTGRDTERAGRVDH